MNETTRKTGLPNLLFQRTTPPIEEPSRPTTVEPEQGTEPEPTPEPELVSGPDPSPEEPSLHRRKTKRKQVRIRRTLHLEDDLDAQLNTVSGIERRERSEIVNDLLRKHLHKYEVTRKK